MDSFSKWQKNHNILDAGLFFEELVMFEKKRKNSQLYYNQQKKFVLKESKNSHNILEVRFFKRKNWSCLKEFSNSQLFLDSQEYVVFKEKKINDNIFLSLFCHIRPLFPCDLLSTLPLLFVRHYVF